MMKRFVFLICVFISNFVIGQIKEEIPVYTIVNKMPDFPGGHKELLKYIFANLKYPTTALESGISGIVYLTFVVMETGEVTDIKVLRGIGGGCDEEAIRIIKSMPRWKAGMQNGKPVRVQYNLPVKFTTGVGVNILDKTDTLRNRNEVIVPHKPDTLKETTIIAASGLSSQKQAQYKKKKRTLLYCPWGLKYLPWLTVEGQVLKHQSVSVGIGWIEHCHGDWTWWLDGLIVNNEFIFKNNRNDFIYSPQISYFFFGPSLLDIYGGIKLSYYTNFKDGGNFVIAPEVGIGIPHIAFTYSRNISIIDNNLIPVNSNNLSLKFFIPLMQ